jgi:hypothetical protein
LAHAVDDRVSPTETEVHRLAAAVRDLFDRSGTPKSNVDTQVVNASIEALAARVRSLLGREPEPARFPTLDRAPIVWRGVTLAPHAPGIWLSADRLWKLTQIVGDPRSVAYLQLDINLLVVDSGDTPEQALEALVTQARRISEKLAAVLDQARAS